MGETGPVVGIVGGSRSDFPVLEKAQALLGELDVPCELRAWHAGPSSWKGRERCNDFSIGIELEGTDDRPFEDAQYETLAPLIHALIARYGALDIAGHSDIAPGRKTDPGPWFDWTRLRASL